MHYSVDRETFAILELFLALKKENSFLFSFTSLFCNSQETFKQELKCQNLLVLTVKPKQLENSREM